MGLEPGDVLGDYRVVREIGRGGMAVVYEAEQMSLRRRVALKVLPEDPISTSQAVNRFRQEAEAGARLRHPNIVPVHEIGEASGTHYIAMELVPGRSLAEVISDSRERCHSEASDLGPEIDRGGDPDDEHRNRRVRTLAASTDRRFIEWAVQIAIDVLRGLEHAHCHDVIHRDIKPRNLLIDEEGRVRIADFGLARLVENPEFSEAGQPHGTPWYMSPEQVAVGMVQIDHRTDIFSVGSTLYEMLTLDRPFPGDTVEQVFRRILHKKPRRLRDANPRLPRDLETIVLKALEKDPDHRYRTAEEFAEDLKRFLEYRDIRACPVGPGRRLIRLVARNRALASVSAALAVTLLIVAVHAVLDRADRRREAADLLSRAAAFRAEEAYDREETVLQELLRHVDPGNEAARTRVAECGHLRRETARRLLDRAARLVAARRYDAARPLIERVLRLAPGDENARRLQRFAGGDRDVRFVIEGGEARLFASEHVPQQHGFAPAVLLGATDAAGLLTATLSAGDHLITAVAADGRFSETWVVVGPTAESWHVLGPRATPTGPVLLRLRSPTDATEGMALVPAGTYSIGSDEPEDGAANPRHDVQLEAFWIDRTEVSNARVERWRRVLAERGDVPPSLPMRVWPQGRYRSELAEEPARLPWPVAVRYLAWEGKRLPAEAEWEAAARGPEGRVYPWGDTWDERRANFQTETIENVGSRGGPGSDCVHGLFDMIGNVEEWTADRFAAYPGWSHELFARHVRDADGEEHARVVFDPSHAVVRGGAYDSVRRASPRASHRSHARTTWIVGLRGVRSASPRVSR